MTVNVKNWQELKKPQALERKTGVGDVRRKGVVAEPLERGFGMTLATRSALPLPLQGAAVTSIRSCVLHEFTAWPRPGDVTDIVLKLKKMH